MAASTLGETCDSNKWGIGWIEPEMVSADFVHERIAATVNGKKPCDFFKVPIGGMNEETLPAFIRGLAEVTPSDYRLRCRIRGAEVTAENAREPLSPDEHEPELTISLKYMPHGRNLPIGPPAGVAKWRGEQGPCVTPKEAMAAIYKLNTAFAASDPMKKLGGDRDKVRDLEYWCANSVWKKGTCLHALKLEAISSEQALFLELMLEHPTECRYWLSS